METIGKMRRRRLVDGASISQVARDLGRALHLRAAALLALIVATLLEFTTAVAADVYKSRDAKVRLVFSDHAPAAPA